MINAHRLRKLSRNNLRIVYGLILIVLLSALFRGQPTADTTEATTLATLAAPTTTQSTTAAVTVTPTTPSTPSHNETVVVHFLDVGQGHATVFQVGEHALIIDGGPRDASSFVVAYLKKMGVVTVDAIIATHYDSDHIYGLVGVLNAFPVLSVYDANYRADTKVFTSFKTAVSAEKCPEFTPAQGDRIAFADLADLEVTFVGPRDYYYDEENDNSLAIRLDYGQASYLIMGDTSSDTEQDMLGQNLDVDILLASHHGSNGSNSPDFLSATSPAHIVISCGADNSYGHPGEYALKRIQKTESELFRTDLQGTLVCQTDGNQINWNQSPANDFTPGD
ncbi:MAG: ComEC/Rec2 family competence protein [Eubacteriales bacterium]|nr:ComEC/Rec2 family competence protein [Eubacteriales bacterium]